MNNDSSWFIHVYILAHLHTHETPLCGPNPQPPKLNPPILWWQELLSSTRALALKNDTGRNIIG